MRARTLGLTLMLLMTLAPGGRGPFAQRPGAPTTATSAVMSPDAGLVAGQTGWDLHVWERQSGKRLATINNHPSLFRGAIAADVLAGISDEKPVVWRGHRYQNKVTLRKLPKVTTFGRVFLSPDGKLVGTLYPRAGDARDPDSFGVWDARTGEPCGALSWGTGRVTGLAFGPGGQVAAFGDEPGKRALLRLYQVSGQAGLKELLSWQGTGETTVAFSAAISPDGKRLALGAGERILLWDLGKPGRPLLGSVETNGARRLFPPQLQVPSVKIPGAHQLHFSPDGKRLAALHGFAVTGIAIWELTRGAREPMKPVGWVRRPPQGQGGSFRQIAWDPAGKLWLITAAYAPVVFVHLARGDHFTLERNLAP